MKHYHDYFAPAMVSKDDLESYATSTTDFYALLSLSPQFSQKQLDSAWRRTALKYHPDKVGASDTSAKEKFHLANIGYELLKDPVIRARYDNARTAREQKRRQTELFESKRRKMKEDLEGREKGVKRGFPHEDDPHEREIRRLKEDGKRRREERQEMLRQEKLREEMLRQEVQEREQTPPPTSITPLNDTPRASSFRFSGGASSLGLEELTMMKLRNAEKRRRLAAEVAQKDETEKSEQA